MGTRGLKSNYLEVIINRTVLEFMKFFKYQLDFLKKDQTLEARTRVYGNYGTFSDFIIYLNSQNGKNSLK